VSAAYDGRAMVAESSPASSRSRLQTAAVYGFSIVVLVAVILITGALGLGVRTTYGSGIDSRLGGQVVHDFLADQDAEAAALSNKDETLLNNRLSDSALTDVAQQIQSQGTTAISQTFGFQPASISVSRAQDPADPTLLIEVQEDGSRNVTTSTGSNAAPTEDQVSFHGVFWLRPSSGGYTIADQSLQNQPTSYVPQIAVVAAGLLWVGLATVLLRRTRAVSSLQSIGTPILPARLPPAAELTSESEPEPVPPKIVIRVFGGLQVLQDGKDWAPALNPRPLMSFVWRRVLLAGLEDRVLTRSDLSRQAHPLLDRDSQLQSLRNLLHKGLRELPEPLRSRIEVEPQVLQFNLADCSVDAIELIRASAENAGRSALSSANAARIRRLVDSSRGALMPEFAAVEDFATDHHPTSASLVTDLEQKFTVKRSDLALLLANTYLAGGRPDEAVAVLEPAIQEQPGRADLVESLVAAYRATGREGEARALVQPKR
jgi:DNA-binding SARP family transcriptional activator